MNSLDLDLTNRDQTTRTRQRRRGFTLIELCISLALITLIATLAIPAFFGRSVISLENAAQLLAGDLRSAQNRATFLSRDIHIHFAEDGSGYWIDDSISEQSGILPPVARRIYSENAVFEGLHVESVELEVGAMLVYQARGAASTSARITIAYGEETRVVTVEADGGKLAIEGSTRSWVDYGY